MDTLKIKNAKDRLSKYSQKHLMALWDTLNPEEQNLLAEQILCIDFDEIFELYDKSMDPNHFSYDVFSPLPHFEKNMLSKEEIDYNTFLGEKIIRSNGFAVITMAGGQGSRLGYHGPKGTYMLDLKPQKKSLFEIMCEDIKKTNKNYAIILPWFIMTSRENDMATKAFFAKNSFFGYPKEKIRFFTQDKLPIITVDKNLILQEPYLIKEASNGNGNVFNAMQKSGIIEQLKRDGISWCSFGGIDNVLLKNVDPLFLGLTIATNNQIASKSIFKKEPLEKTAVYCKKDGKPSILDYDDIDLAISEKKDDKGMYLYRDANILSHIMSIEAIEKVSKCTLPYHRAYKKNAFVNLEGVKQVPDKPNTFKFEQFIFDAFNLFDDMLLLRVEENEEFAPIKDFTSIYNPDTAIEKYNRTRKID